MAATMKWKVENLVYYPTKDGKPKVVYDVSWRCNGTEEKDGETYSSSAAGNNIITYDADASFTAFDDLTEDQVLGWIWKTDSDDEDDMSKICWFQYDIDIDLFKKVCDIDIDIERRISALELLAIVVAMRMWGWHVRNSNYKVSFHKLHSSPNTKCTQ